jgi:hypothetical protein
MTGPSGLNPRVRVQAELLELDRMDGFSHN